MNSAPTVIYRSLDATAIWSTAFARRITQPPRFSRVFNCLGASRKKYTSENGSELAINFPLSVATCSKVHTKTINVLFKTEIIRIWTLSGLTTRGKSDGSRISLKFSSFCWKCFHTNFLVFLIYLETCQL